MTNYISTFYNTNKSLSININNYLIIDILIVAEKKKINHNTFFIIDYNSNKREWFVIYVSKLGETYKATIDDITGETFLS